jgi:hypothetical protein
MDLDGTTTEAPGGRCVVNTVNGDRVEVDTPCCHYNLRAPLRQSFLNHSIIAWVGEFTSNFAHKAKLIDAGLMSKPVWYAKCYEGLSNRM